MCQKHWFPQTVTSGKCSRYSSQETVGYKQSIIINGGKILTAHILITAGFIDSLSPQKVAFDQYRTNRSFFENSISCWLSDQSIMQYTSLLKKPKALTFA